MAKIVNGEKRGRPGRWLVDYRDALGKRRWITCETRREAEDRLAEVLRQSRQPRRSALDPRTTLSEYAVIWLPRVAATAKPRTVDAYRIVLRLHVEPVLGGLAVRNITRPQARALLVGLLAHKARKTVQVALAVLRTMLGAAVEDGLLAANPCTALGRALKLGVSAGPQATKALDAAQVAALLDAIRTAPASYDRRLYPFFVTLARTGLRIGEAIGLKWEDVDLVGRQLLIRRQISHRVLGTPKSNRERVVSASWGLVAVLRRHQTDLKAESLKRGWGGVPEWVFVTTDGTPLDESRTRGVMKRALGRAGLPGHFTPHCLRHSFASILLARGESPQFVQEQLGHASLELTTRVYGRWLPKQPLRGGVDGLDESGSKTVAPPAAVGLHGAQVRAGTDGRVVSLTTSPSAAPEFPRSSPSSPRPSSARTPAPGRPTSPRCTRSAGRRPVA